MANMMLDLRNVGLVSASTPINENEDLPAPDFPSKPSRNPIRSARACSCAMSWVKR